ncbi:MAG: cellulase family glycosylhydrolase, partial [Martelella sp.]
MGNMLEPEKEGAWGGALIVPEDFARIKAAGFDTVRIPVRWHNKTKQETPWTVDPAWMDRVQTVVDEALAADLNVILNSHHFDPIFEDPAGVAEWHGAVWKQIAERFAAARTDMGAVVTFTGVVRDVAGDLQGMEIEPYAGTPEKALDKIARANVDAAARHLVIPGAVRSLAPLPALTPHEVRHDGQLLNDPANPYWGRYEGDEDTRRKPAYHNGTAWTWFLPQFCEALVCAWPSDPGAVEAAKGYLGSVAGLMNEGCLGQVPEI